MKQFTSYVSSGAFKPTKARGILSPSPYYTRSSAKTPGTLANHLVTTGSRLAGFDNFSHFPRATTSSPIKVGKFFNNNKLNWTFLPYKLGKVCK